jgi:hypothetical protein
MADQGDPHVKLDFEVDASKALKGFADIQTGSTTAFGGIGKLQTGLGALAKEMTAFGKATADAFAPPNFGKALTGLDTFFKMTGQSLPNLGALVGKMKETGTASVGLGEQIAKLADGFNNIVQAGSTLLATLGKASELAHFSAELKNLEDHVPVKRLEMMQEATEGAVNKMDLMRFSMRALNGEVALNEEGMETLLKAANTLGDKGFGDTKENAEKLLDVIHRGSTRELREFGIILDDTGDKLLNAQNALEAYKRIAQEEAPVDETLKNIERVQTAWSDFVISAKQGLGEVVIAIAQGIAELLGLMPKTALEKRLSAARGLAQQEFPLPTQLVNTEEGVPAWRTSTGALWTQEQYEQRRGLQELKFQEFFSNANRYAGPRSVYLFGGSEEDRAAAERADRARVLSGVVSDDWERYMGAFGGVPARHPSGGAGRSRGAEAPGLGGFYSPEGSVFKQFMGDTSGTTGLSPGEGLFGQFMGNTSGTTGLSPSTGPGLLDQFMGDEQAEKQKQLLDDLKDHSTALGASFDVVSSGLSAAVDAAITGSDSIGNAFKKASATALKALAVEYSVRALGEAGMAIVSLATYDYGGAAAHGLAAAKLTAAAIAAGAGSALLGGGGGGGSGGASPGATPGGGYASIGGGTGAGSGGPSTIIVQVGEGFVGRSDELAVAIKDKLDAGARSGRVRYFAPGQSAVTFRQ